MKFRLHWDFACVEAGASPAALTSVSAKKEEGAPSFAFFAKVPALSLPKGAVHPSVPGFPCKKRKNFTARK